MPSARPSLVKDKRPESGQYALLRGVPLFAALDDAAVEELCGYLHPVELKAGSSLFRVGDSGDAMYFIERGRVSRNANEEDAKHLTLADRAADKIAKFGGSWKFISASILFTLCWIALNTWLLHDKGFDAYPYVLLNLVIGMIASLSAPVIMMSQNREAQKDRLRADLDYQVNLKNEMLLGEILRLLEKREKDAPKRYEDEE